LAAETKSGFSFSKLSLVISVMLSRFNLPLDKFYLRNDLQRLAEEIPDLKYFELPVLEKTELPEL
jgi:hypothetical protein